MGGKRKSAESKGRRGGRKKNPVKSKRRGGEEDGMKGCEWWSGQNSPMMGNWDSVVRLLIRNAELLVTSCLLFCCLFYLFIILSLFGANTCTKLHTTKGIICRIGVYVCVCVCVCVCLCV